MTAHAPLLDSLSLGRRRVIFLPEPTFWKRVSATTPLETIQLQHRLGFPDILSSAQPPLDSFPIFHNKAFVSTVAVCARESTISGGTQSGRRYLQP